MRLPQERCRLTTCATCSTCRPSRTASASRTPTCRSCTAWIAGAGVRWGLNEAQRADLGLEACGEQNTWLLRAAPHAARAMPAAWWPARRSTASSPTPRWAGSTHRSPGSLAAMVDALTHWWQQAVGARAAGRVGRARARCLLALVKPADERDRVTLATLDDALRRWLEACDTAAFEERVPLAAVREAWLSGVDEPGLGRRFLGGGVTFCTLMPMRSIPFEVVCLLGMNDGDYPRSTSRSDFDLMGLPGQSRPGDRSRRDDDRQLMLEARAQRAAPALRQLDRPQRARQQRAAAVGAGLAVPRLPRGGVDAATCCTPAPPNTRCSRSAAATSRAGRCSRTPASGVPRTTAARPPRPSRRSTSTPTRRCPSPTSSRSCASR